MKALTPAKTFVVVEQFSISLHQPNHSLQKVHKAVFISLSLFELSVETATPNAKNVCINSWHLQPLIINRRLLIEVTLVKAKFCRNYSKPKTTMCNTCLE